MVKNKEERIEDSSFIDEEYNKTLYGDVQSLIDNSHIMNSRLDVIERQLRVIGQMVHNILESRYGAGGS